MQGPPALSIVICTRNRADRLPRALHALSALNSAAPWEALIVDNGSTDATMQVIRAHAAADKRLRVLRVATIGLGAARDAAWRQARAPIVAFTDDDCYVQADYVDAVLRVFAEHPDIGCVGGRILLHDPADAPVTIDTRDAAHDYQPGHFIDAGEFQGANIAFRRAALERIGGFDRALGAGTPWPCEDIDAVAATLWAGMGARFDPRPVVAHHHGRRMADLPRLEAGYDRGRGAYYAKYLLRPDSRRACWRGWWRQANRGHYRSSLRRLNNEILAASRYVLTRHRYGFLLVAAVPAAAAYLLFVARCARRHVTDRLGPRQPRNT